MTFGGGTDSSIRRSGHNYTNSNGTGGKKMLGGVNSNTMGTVQGED